MRVIITGGRNYNNVEHIHRVLQEIHNDTPITYLIHGACKTGVDKIADNWAKNNGIKREPHPADWTKYGLAAGPIRNKEMAESGANLCIVFPGGKGTTSMINNTKRYNIQILQADLTQV